MRNGASRRKLAGLIRTSPAPTRPPSTHQESRDHHTHNHPGQDGHEPQRHSPAEEKS
ncbi:hypothetical protein [Methylobacterium aquaticum]|uniref:hypothetical protein n=1 Tax=Methylobacterium aquaticum TaxID=270351 RepID=UPI001934B42F|nr:hypothetical protein [Methylobacterium aquaticum]